MCLALLASLFSMSLAALPLDGPSAAAEEQLQLEIRQ
jgi:hypothetical protein